MEGSGSATLIFKIPKYNENSSSKEPKIWQSFALLFCVNMKMSRTWGGRLLIATSSDWMDKRRPLCFLFDSLWVQTTLLQMLVSDPRHQPGILGYHWPAGNISFLWGFFPDPEAIPKCMGPLTINSPYVNSNIFTMGNRMPESTLSPSQELDLASGLEWLIPYFD